jgi:multidrug efflux system membrane fusion protein
MASGEELNTSTALAKRSVDSEAPVVARFPPRPVTPPASEDVSKKQAPPSRSPWIWLAATVLMGVAIYFAWEHYTRPAAGVASTAAGKTGAAAIPVTAARSRKGDIDVYDTGLGAVTPILTVNVKSRVDGQLMSVRYKEGDLVHKGDLLLDIDPRPYQVQLTLAQGQLLKDQAALANARIDLARYQELLGKSLVPEQQVATQEALVSQDEAAIKTDQGQVDSANLNITYCHITALITGRVGLRLVDPGNMVHASDANALLVITQMQPISVIFTLAEDQLQVVLKKMRAGDKLPVDAYDRDMKSKLAEGSLTALDNEIDPTTGTLKLRATFDNEQGTLFPNQFINVRLLVDRKQGVTVVPTAAVQRNAQATYVYAVKPDSTVTVRPITTGTTEGDDTEVVTGLAPDEVVVMTGVDKLQEGSKVNAQFPSTSGRGQAATSSPGQAPTSSRGQVPTTSRGQAPKSR